MEVIRDDMSAAGLRRVHLMDGRGVSLGCEKDRLGDGWNLVEFAKYEDDLGFWHLHLYYWRQGMTTMQVCATYTKDHMGALVHATAVYQRKFGQTPNVAYVHEGAPVAEAVELRGANGEVHGVVRLKRVSWMLPWDVGVCVETE